MKQYKIKVIETRQYAVEHYVTADSEAEAVKNVKEGLIDESDDSDELLDVTDIAVDGISEVEVEEDQEIDSNDVIQTIMNQVSEIDTEDLDMSTDGSRQIVIETGIYVWQDGTFHTTEEPADE